HPAKVIERQDEEIIKVESERGIAHVEKNIADLDSFVENTPKQNTIEKDKFTNETETQNNITVKEKKEEIKKEEIKEDQKENPKFSYSFYRGELSYLVEQYQQYYEKLDTRFKNSL